MTHDKSRILFIISLLMLLMFSANAQQAPIPLPTSTDDISTRAIGTLIQKQKLTASDGVDGDAFGSYQIAIEGDTALIGARFKDTSTGVVYVFERDTSTGLWEETQKLTASDAAEYNFFGVAIALEGNIAMIGASGNDSYKGAVYVFERNIVTGLWEETQKLIASDADAVVQRTLGSALDLDGDRAIIGASGFVWATTAPQGQAYIFERNSVSGLWEEVQILTASDGVADNYFGESVEIEGDVAVSAAADSVYVFERNTNTDTWTESKKFTGSGELYYGGSITLYSKTLMVGSPFNDTKKGAVYVYKPDASTGEWGEVQKLTASDAVSDDRFGTSVFIDGENALIGASGFNSNRGSVYTFAYDSGTGDWIEQQKFIALDSALDDNFGRAVALDGQTALVGTLQGESAYIWGLSEPTLNIELSADSTSLIEGDTGTSASGLSLLVSGGISTVINSVDITLTNGTATSADSDYSHTSATVSIPAGDYSTVQSIAIPVEALGIVGDTKIEADESLTVALSNAGLYAQIGDANGDSVTQSSATVTITNDDSAVVTIEDVSMNEGDSGASVLSFTATVDNAVQGGFTVDYTTSDDTATAGEDYATTSGTLNFTGTVGESITFSVSVNGDTDLESNETFTVTLSNSSNDAVTASDTATGTILNDDFTFEILTNGGFEGESQPGKIPVDWNGRDTKLFRKDKQKCNKDKDGDGIIDKFVANSGDCAFMFKGNPTGERTKLNRKFSDLSPFTDGALVTLSVYVDKRSAKVGHPFGKLIIKYDNDTKDKRILRIPDAEGYTLVTDDVTIDLTGRSITVLKVSFRNKLTSGKFFIDDASLKVTPATTLKQREALPLPEEPDSFRD